MKRTLSLKWRAVLGVTALTVSVLVLVSAVQLHFIHRDFARVLAEQQYALVARMAQEIDTKFETYTDLLVRSAAGLPPALMQNPEALREHYRALPGLLAHFDDVLVLRPDGRVIADYPALPGRAGFSAAGRAYFAKVMATRRPVVAEPLRGKITGEPLVQIVVPILGPDGEIIGVLEGILRLYKKNFLAELAATPVGKKGYFVILTKEAEPRYVVHPDKRRILEPRVPGGSFSITRALEGIEGSSEDTSSSSVASLYSYKSLRTVDWVLIAAVPTEEAYSPLDVAAQRLWLISLIVCLLVIPLVWSLAWLILRPVSLLRDEMDKLRGAGGRGYRPVPVVQRDEIGDLTRSFNALMRERAIAESRQHDTEERLRTITDNLPALIAYVDADERYRFVNRFFNDWYPMQDGVYVGRKLSEVVGEGYAIDGPAVQYVLSTGEPISYRREVQVGREMRNLESSMLPDREPDGRVIGVYVLANDITSLVRAKDQLRDMNAELEARVHERTAALELSNRELETFAYSVAHDFRAPLRAMDGYSALLLEEQGARLEEEGRDYLARIRASSNRLGTLIDDLLRLAELNQKELRHENVDLSVIAAQVVAVLRATLPDRLVDVVVAPGLIGHGDRALLTALMKELLDNAWKFTAGETHPRIEVGSEQRDGVAAYFVRDDGVGFDMAFAQKVFTPFARLHSPEEFSGTGIGLALAKRIVDRHGGKLWAQAEDGRGAVFWFTLDQAPESVAEAP